MNSVDLAQLQLSEKLLESQHESQKVSLSDADLAEFKSDMNAFLGKHSEIMVSNKQQAQKKDNGFFVLTMSLSGIQLMHSSPLKKNIFEFSYQSNALILNNRAVERSFLNSFTNKIKYIANRMASEDYQVIKR